MEFIYVGNPHDHGEGPRELVIEDPDDNERKTRYVFERGGKAIDVGEGRLAGKLKNNDHFQIVESKKRLGHRKPDHFGAKDEPTPAGE
jgi:hypothetical protein